MRILVAFLALLMIAAPTVADDAVTDDQTALEPQDHEAGHEDSPGLGLIAALAAVGAVAFFARRR